MRNIKKIGMRLWKMPITVFLLCMPIFVLAADEPQEQSFRGSAIRNAINTNTLLTAADPIFNQVPGAPAWSSQNSYGVQNVVQFEIDFNNINNIFFHNLNFTATCNVDIKCYSDPLNPNAITQTYSGIVLEVNYNPTTGAIYKGIANYKFNGAYKTEVKINSLTSTGLSSTDDYPIFMLTNKLIVSRQYNFVDVTSIPTKYSTDRTKLDINWIPTNYPGAESFDLEWTYADAASLAGMAIAAAPPSGLPVTQLDQYFRNNSSRVNLSGNHYQLNLNYNDGYIIFRIRGVQVKNTDGIRMEANWNYNASPQSTSYYNYFQQGIVQVDWHEKDLNWQYNSSYAEDGKKKEVINYFDGSLRSRQTVTLNNEDDKAIIAEPVYDAMGRSTMSILPAPIDNNKLKYYPSFNLSSRAGMPPVSYKDIPYANCNIIASTLSTTSGTEQYYSANNPFISNPVNPWNKAIPKSEGFPFAVTLYTPDNTGRIRSQGGVGAAFQLGTGHETKYFYGKPSQYELDRIFGAEAGNMTHYLKNMVVDANKQVSISYQNSEGKTIATALAGVPPLNQEALGTATPPTEIIHDVLLTPSSFHINSANSSIEANTTFLVSSTGNYKFTYRFTPEQYREIFSQGTLCYNCSYDLLLTIKDECGTELKKIDIIKKTDYNIVCNTPTEISDFFNLSINDVGEYSANFELVVNKEVLDRYTADYLVRNTDIKKLNYFLLQQLLEEDLSQCYSDCEACKTLPPLVSDFILQIKAYYDAEGLSFGPDEIAYATTLYDRIQSNCIPISQQCVSNPCQEILDILKPDVSPGGQYAEFDNEFNLEDPEINVLRFYTQLTYVDENNQPAMVEDDNGNMVPPQNLSLKEFIQKFEESWANSLVVYHPEYCYYRWCGINEESQLFNNRLENMDDPRTAITDGYFDRGNPKKLLELDPFFNGGNGSSYYNNMADDLDQYSTNVLHINQSVKSILGTIDYLLYCGNLTPVVQWDNCSKPVDDPCRSDFKEWILYKEWYLERKLKYYTQAMKDNDEFRDCTNCFIPSSGPLDPGGFTNCTPPDISNFTVSNVLNSNADGLKRILIKYRGGNEVLTWPLQMEIRMTSPAGIVLIQPIVFAPGFGTQEVTVSEEFNSFEIISVICAQVIDGKSSPLKNKKSRFGYEKITLTQDISLKNPIKETLAITKTGIPAENKDALNQATAEAKWMCPADPSNFTITVTPLNLPNTVNNSAVVEVCYTGPTIPAGKKINVHVGLYSECTGNMDEYVSFCSTTGNCVNFLKDFQNCGPITEILDVVCEDKICEEWKCPESVDAFVISSWTEYPNANGEFSFTTCYLGPPIPYGKKVTVEVIVYSESTCGTFSYFEEFCSSTICKTHTFPTSLCGPSPGRPIPAIRGVALGKSFCTDEPCNSWTCPTDPSNYTIQYSQLSNGDWQVNTCYFGQPIPAGKKVTVEIVVASECGPISYFVNFCAESALCHTKIFTAAEICKRITGVSNAGVTCTDEGCEWECPTNPAYFTTTAVPYPGTPYTKITVCYTGPAIPPGRTVIADVQILSDCGSFSEQFKFCSTTGPCISILRYYEKCVVSGASVGKIYCNDEPCADWICPTEVSNYSLQVNPLSNGDWQILTCYTGPAIPVGKKVKVKVIVNTGCGRPIIYFVSFCAGSSLCNAHIISKKDGCKQVEAQIGEVLCTDESCSPEPTPCPTAGDFSIKEGGTCSSFPGFNSANINVSYNAGPLTLVSPTQRVNVYLKITTKNTITNRTYIKTRAVRFINGMSSASLCFLYSINRIITSIEIAGIQCSTSACTPGDCCDDPRYSLYEGKVRRYQDYVEPPDFNSIMTGYYNGSLNFTAYPMMTCKNECETMADGWMQDLKNCTTDPVRLERVRRRLIAVCKQSCVAQQGNNSIYPYSDANPAPSFESVIAAEFGPVRPGCSYDLLSNPYPWGKNPLLEETYAMETNAKICTTLLQYRNEAVSHGYAGSITDVQGVHKYLRDYYLPYYSLDIEELQDLFKGCDECNNIMPLPVELPNFMDGDAKPCLNCAQFALLEQQFQLKYPTITTTHPKYEVLFKNFVNHKTGFSHIFGDYADFKDKCVLNQNDFLNKGHICETPVQQTAETDPIRQCLDEKFYNALTSATVIYERYIEEIKRIFRNNYTTKCLSALASLETDAKLYEYHYTLYYYDQSSNLVKTIPPKGVALLSTADIINLQANRATSTIVPPHTLATTYEYNSFNQVVKQATPDAGVSEFWYDRLGRLVVSQNAEQKLPAAGGAAAGRYSYTKYEPILGRITEVGEKTGAPDINSYNTKNENSLASWFVTGTDKQITETIYDKADPTRVMNTTITNEQANYTGRKRVVAALFKKVRGATPNLYDAATHYSYDINGNAKTIWQENTRLKEADAATQGLKRMDYDFDLISGKVNKVYYQKNKGDQFIYKYEYDAENRVIGTQSSRDGLLWMNDATYKYYLHGPLARTELGNLKVQGLDYAYTLQGWMKHINAPAINEQGDIGRDGDRSLAGNPFERSSRDAMGYGISYFGGDYKPIQPGSSLLFAENIPSAITGKDLYNGNIRATTLQLAQLGTPKTYSYGYDQLNRIVKMRQHEASYTPAAGSTAAALNIANAGTAYMEGVSYDANGNILSYLRNGTAAQPAMDNLTYNYIPGTNKLLQVQDGVIATAYGEDIDDQAPNNYTYDKTGNLIKDNAEKIGTIEWTVYGKISKITKTDVANTIIEYEYDAAGNRIYKKVTANGNPVVTFYTRDASGNTMALYNKTGAATVQWGEQHLYGSSRLGLINLNVPVPPAPLVPATGAVLADGFEYGKTNYELSNHLGNVLVTVSDKKIGLDNNSDGVIDYYNADVVTANDYYPGGMQMPGRSYFTGSQYRYGFNGQEKTPEIFEGSTTAKFWEYDSRTGRRWNVDPVVNPSESPYATNKDNPVQQNDPNGDVSSGGPGDPTVSAGIKLTVGSHNTSLSFSFSATQKVGNFTLSAGGAVTTFSNFFNTGKKGVELRGSILGGFDNGKNSFTLGTNKFGSLGKGLKDFSQRTGVLNAKIGDFSFSYENDGSPFPKARLSDGGDRYRTAAATIGIGEFSAGFNLFTGSRTDYRGDKYEMARGAQTGSFGECIPHGCVNEVGPQYRMGAAYVAYGSTKLGIESDRYIRHPIQDIFAHHILSPQPGFDVLSKTINPFFQIQPKYLFSVQRPVRFSLYE